MPVLISAALVMSHTLLKHGSMPTTAHDIALRAQMAFPGLKPDDFAMSYLDLSNEAKDGYNGSVPMYPASVVKMFFMAYAEELIEKKKLIRNAEFDRALIDMIKESNNDATGLILESITGTTGGPSLSEKEMAKWMDKRQSVNKWLKTLGFQGINCSQKTWNEGPYGRERDGYGPNFEKRNSLTADACVKMMALIQSGKLAGTNEMLGLLSRKAGSTEGQVKGFLGELAPANALLWSKAGWTDTVRHDVACVSVEGHKKIYAIFTKYKVGEPKLIQWLATELLKL